MHSSLILWNIDYVCDSVRRRHTNQITCNVIVDQSSAIKLRNIYKVNKIHVGVTPSAFQQEKIQLIFTIDSEENHHLFHQLAVIFSIFFLWEWKIS